MKQRLEAVAWIGTIIFCAITLWCVTVKGLFEPVRVDVGHFEAEAGDILCPTPGGTCSQRDVPLVVLVLFRRPLPLRLLTGLAASLVIPLILNSCLGV